MADTDNVQSLTAYVGLLEVGNVKHTKPKTLLVSAAAGATGSIVCRIATRVLGIQHVIGIAGSAEKCRLLKEIGCHVTLNYKDPDFLDQLDSCTPEYIDLFFDNVGGFVLDYALQRMAKNGRIVSCSSVSSYNNVDARGISAKSWSLVVSFLSSPCCTRHMRSQLPSRSE